MKKSLLIAVSSLVVLAGCGPTNTSTTTTTVVKTWTVVSWAVSSLPVVVSSSSQANVVVQNSVSSIAPNSVSSIAPSSIISSSVAPVSNSSVAVVSSAPVVVINSSVPSLNESMAVINNTKFAEVNCEKIKEFMACSIKAITWENQALAANQMAIQLKQMTADANRAKACDSQYNMLKSSPELAMFESQVKCKLQ